MIEREFARIRDFVRMPRPLGFMHEVQWIEMLVSRRFR